MQSNQQVDSKYIPAAELFGASFSDAHKKLFAEADIKKLLPLIQSQATLVDKLNLFYKLFYQVVEKFVVDYPTHHFPVDFIADMRRRLLEEIALLDKSPPASKNDPDVFMKSFSSVLYVLTPFSVEYRHNVLKSKVYELTLGFIESQLCVDDKSSAAQDQKGPNRALIFLDEFKKYFDTDTRFVGKSDLEKLLNHMNKFIQQHPAVKLQSVMRYDLVSLLGNLGDNDFKLASSELQPSDSFQMQVFKLCRQIQNEKDPKRKEALVEKQAYYFNRLQYYLKLCLIFESVAMDFAKHDNMIFAMERNLFGKVRDDVLPKAFKNIDGFRQYIQQINSHLFKDGYTVLGRVCVLPGCDDNRYYLHDEKALKEKYLEMEKGLLSMIPKDKNKNIPIKFQIDLQQYFLLGQLYEMSKAHTNNPSRLKFVLRVLSDLYLLVEKSSVETTYQKMHDYLSKVVRASQEIKIVDGKFVAKESGKSLKALCDICNALSAVIKPVVQLAGHPSAFHSAPQGGAPASAANAVGVASLVPVAKK